jgi:hypothetical protein
MERSVVSEMPRGYRANKLPTSRLSCERDMQRQRTPARIWRRLIATDGVWLSRSSPFGERHGCGESAEAGSPHDDMRPWRDCDISRLATLLWRCQQSSLAGQVRGIYCIHDLARWPDLDQRQEQENNDKIRIDYRQDAVGEPRHAAQRICWHVNLRVRQVGRKNVQ